MTMMPGERRKSARNCPECGAAPDAPERRGNGTAGLQRMAGVQAHGTPAGGCADAPAEHPGPARVLRESRRGREIASEWTGRPIIHMEGSSILPKRGPWRLKTALRGLHGHISAATRGSAFGETAEAAGAKIIADPGNADGPGSLAAAAADVGGAGRNAPGAARDGGKHPRREPRGRTWTEGLRHPPRRGPACTPGSRDSGSPCPGRSPGNRPRCRAGGPSRGHGRSGGCPGRSGCSSRSCSPGPTARRPGPEPAWLNRAWLDRREGNHPGGNADS